MSNRSLDRGTGSNFRRPLHKKRHAKPTLKHGDFPAAEWAIYILDADVTGTTVITGKDDHRIIGDAFCVQRIEDTTETAVNCANHARVNPLAVWFNAAERIVVFSRGLQGCVRAPMSQIKKERAILVGLDHLDRFVSPIVRKVASGLEFIRIARVVRR